MFVSLKLKLLKWVKIVKRLRIRFCVWCKKACVQQFPPSFKTKKTFLYFTSSSSLSFIDKSVCWRTFFWKIILFIRGDIDYIWQIKIEVVCMMIRIKSASTQLNSNLKFAYSTQYSIYSSCLNSEKVYVFYIKPGKTVR